jgi:hypothetical protein
MAAMTAYRFRAARMRPISVSSRCDRGAWLNCRIIVSVSTEAPAAALELYDGARQEARDLITPRIARMSFPASRSEPALSDAEICIRHCLHIMARSADNASAALSREGHGEA